MFYIYVTELQHIHGFVQVQVRCSLVYMDFEGRSDGRSIKNILSHVAPLKLVWISLVLFSLLKYIIESFLTCIWKFIICGMENN